MLQLKQPRKLLLVPLPHQKFNAKLAIEATETKLLMLYSPIMNILTQSNGGKVRRLWLKSFAHLALDSCDLSANNCKREIQKNHRIRLKKINCMSQSCCTRLFFGVRLIQQNSSFSCCFFACLIFFQFLINLLVKIYMKRHNRHNKTLCTTDFFNSVFCLVSCLSINQVPYFILNKL